jgi:Tfp pilus assembly protein PilV
MKIEQNGQSLLELIIAIGVFVTVISGIALLILHSFVSVRLSAEISKANFLAEEGLEAVRSIRDDSWDNLTSGNHGLAVSASHWVFQGSSEDLSSELRGGNRVINIENLDADRKKITSNVNWQFTENQLQQVKLITYLTNWQKETLPSNCTGTPTSCDTFPDISSCLTQQGCIWLNPFCNDTCTPCDTLSWWFCRQQDGCSWSWRNFECSGVCTPCDTYQSQGQCNGQQGCNWYVASCGGTPTPCETFITETECLSQAGCQWIIP